MGNVGGVDVNFVVELVVEKAVVEDDIVVILVVYVDVFDSKVVVITGDVLVINC